MVLGFIKSNKEEPKEQRLLRIFNSKLSELSVLFFALESSLQVSNKYGAVKECNETIAKAYEIFERSANLFNSFGDVKRFRIIKQFLEINSIDSLTLDVDGLTPSKIEAKAKIFNKLKKDLETVQFLEKTSKVANENQKPSSKSSNVAA